MHIIDIFAIAAGAWILVALVTIRALIRSANDALE